METNREQQRKGVRQAVQRSWHEMNRKQRRELTRKIRAEDLSLEVVHPDAVGIDIGNESHTWPSLRPEMASRCARSDAPRPSCRRWLRG